MEQATAVVKDPVKKPVKDAEGFIEQFVEELKKKDWYNRPSNPESVNDPIHCVYLALAAFHSRQYYSCKDWAARAIAIEESSAESPLAHYLFALAEIKSGKETTKILSHLQQIPEGATSQIIENFDFHEKAKLLIGQLTQKESYGLTEATKIWKPIKAVSEQFVSEVSKIVKQGDDANWIPLNRYWLQEFNDTLSGYESIKRGLEYSYENKNKNAMYHLVVALCVYLHSRDSSSLGFLFERDILKLRESLRAIPKEATPAFVLIQEGANSTQPWVSVLTRADNNAYEEAQRLADNLTVDFAAESVAKAVRQEGDAREKLAGLVIITDQHIQFKPQVEKYTSFQILKKLYGNNNINKSVFLKSLDQLNVTKQESLSNNLLNKVERQKIMNDDQYVGTKKKGAYIGNRASEKCLKAAGLCFTSGFRAVFGVLSLLPHEITATVTFFSAGLIPLAIATATFLACLIPSAACLIASAICFAVTPLMGEANKIIGKSNAVPEKEKQEMLPVRHKEVQQPKKSVVPFKHQHGSSLDEFSKAMSASPALR